jgi:hypothetical protein
MVSVSNKVVFSSSTFKDFVVVQGGANKLEDVSLCSDVSKLNSVVSPAFV